MKRESKEIIRQIVLKLREKEKRTELEEWIYSQLCFVAFLENIDFYTRYY